MASTITAGNATNGLALSCDNTGILELKTGTGSGTTAITADASQNVTVAGTLTAPSVIPSSSTAPTNGVFLPAANTLGFSTASTERARIDSSGNLLVGCTSLPGSGTTGTAFQPGASISGMCTWTNRSSTTAASDHAYFYNPNGVVGFIRTTNSATSYSTSSDYRLKHDIAPMTGALAKVAALNPVTYKWNADDSAGEGFIAHELQEVVPDCVHGEKDAVDADGDPVYQGIDTSFLVATLTAAIKEQQQMIETLQAKVAALEAK